MSNKTERETKEMYNLFADPKYARKAWREVGCAIARRAAIAPTPIYDKDGIETMASQIERYSFAKLSKDLKELNDPNNTTPTELEMILQCQIVKARFDTSAATFVRDTLGAKPVDESKIDAQVSNPYETLTDEELEILAAVRAKKDQNNDEV